MNVRNPDKYAMDLRREVKNISRELSEDPEKNVPRDRQKSPIMAKIGQEVNKKPI